MVAVMRSSPPCGHGVAGVGGEVQQHLLDLAAVGDDPLRLRRRLDEQRDVGAEQAAEHRLHRGDRLVEIEGGRQQHALAAEGEELRRQAGGAAAGGQDLLEVLADGTVGLEDRQHRLAEAVDDHQHVVEVVRDAAGEAAERLHLLRLAHLPFEVLARRVVEDVAVDRHQLAVGVEAPDQALDHRDDAAVDAAQRALVLAHRAVAPYPLDEVGEPAVGIQRAEVGAERVGQRGEAADLDEGRVAAADLPAGRGDEDAGEVLVERLPVALVALLQRVLDAAAIGDVAGGAFEVPRLAVGDDDPQVQADPDRRLPARHQRQLEVGVGQATLELATIERPRFVARIVADERERLASDELRGRSGGASA